jgi:hypothetical protein
MYLEITVVLCYFVTPEQAWQLWVRHIDRISSDIEPRIAGVRGAQRGL